jgi:steroid 5-alpha reductase family enzyme
MSTIEILALSAAVTLAYVTAVWLLSLVLRNASIIDIAWGLGFVFLGTLYHVALDGWGDRRVLVATLVLIWGLRLSIHLLWRSWGKGEDFRYRTWREEDPENFWWKSYFRVFLVQGVALWVISQPLRAAQESPTPDHLTAFDIIGTIVWAIGFLFEVVGDYQLARFKGDPANEGKVMDRGLWRFTRHPNYFGDATLWWGFYLIAAGASDGWLTIYSPLLMTFILMRVSGVTFLERTLKRTKPDYEGYARRTSAFFPWFPAKSA